MNHDSVKQTKEQYPPGTRIRLANMRDPYSPVPPGTMGTVKAVDDVGTIHMKWDNGRMLGLVPGEDSFSVVEQELTHAKLYMSLRCSLYENSEYEGPYDIDGREALCYADSISNALQKHSTLEEAERGLMRWYHEKDGVNEKVHSARFSLEERADSLWGIVKLELKGELNDAEATTLVEYLTGQASDGWGEGFEQQDITVDDGSILNVHLWSSGKDWKMMTEAEFTQRYEQTQTQAPQMESPSF